MKLAKRTGYALVKKSSSLKSALFVVGGGIAAAPAAALEIGDIRVHSTIGQPLRASIAYALGPNEALADTCVSLQPMRGGSGLPSVDRGSLIVADGVIAIAGSAVVREPLMSLRLNIRCPYTPHLTRDYMMFIDPAGTTPEPIAAPTPERVASQPQLEAPPVRATQPAPRQQRPVEPITEATRYRVQPGDTLSGIAQRIENRPVGLWAAVNTIFAANPDAFIDDDPNKLKAGSWLSIPSFGADAAATIAAAPSAGEAVNEPVTTGSAYEPAVTEAANPVAEPAASPVDASPLADLRPGDVILDGDNPFIAPVDTIVDESVVIPDTTLVVPESTASNPNVPVQIIQPAPRTEPTTTNWLLWLGGGGIAIIVAMLLFGRVFRSRFGSAPIAPAVPQRRRTDGNTENLEVIGDVQLDFPDDSPTAENVALDADLIAGTGLQQGTDVDVAQDFGFAATTDLDLELPEEISSGGQTGETDILSPLNIDESSILDSEILPEDDDYDMSVIVDATKMPLPEDVTERDLEAVRVDVGDDTLITGDYTLSQEVDYKVLEQDYEDEMTATQALNAEIKKAAEDLAASLDEADLDENVTAEMPLATVHELDVTSQMKSREDIELDDDDDTGINPTVNMEAAGDTVELVEDNTVEMPKNNKAG